MATNEVSPPRWIEKLLRFVLDDEIAESVIGDITEKFKVRSASGRHRSASWLYVLEGLMLLRLVGYSKKLRQPVSSGPFSMIGSYLVVAYRNLKRERIYWAMSVAGMAIGLASILVVYVYVRFELSYDRFHENHDRIVRITSEYDDDGVRVQSAKSDERIFTIVSENVPGISSVVRILPLNGLVSSNPQSKVRENRFCHVDSTFFTFFSFDAVQGSLTKALDAPFSLVITESAANRYFGTTSVIGRELIFEDEVWSAPYDVVAVIKDIPQNSHFTAGFFAPLSSLKNHPYYNDGYPPIFMYAMLETAEPVADVDARLKSVFEIYKPSYLNEVNRFRSGGSLVLGVQALDDIHLNSHKQGEWEANSFYIYIEAFGALALFILFIACINFINLATAQAIKRGREIGVRKVFGGLKLQITIQFLTETFAHVVIAFAASLVLAEIALQFFLRDIIGKELSVLTMFELNTILIVAGFILLVSLLAGIYPSIYLAKMGPSSVLKGLSLKQGGEFFRQGLVAFQVIISCLLISGTVIIVKQVEYFRTIDLGFDKEQVMVISLTDRFAAGNYSTLSDRLRQESFVVSTGLSSTVPGRGNFYGWDILPEGRDKDQPINIKTLGVDEGFAETYGLRFIEGRNFSREIPTDENEGFILNEAAATMLNWDRPVGKELQLTTYIAGRKIRNGKVIGLVKDFNFESLHSKVEPLLIYINKHVYYADNLSVRIKSGNLPGNIDRIAKVWREFHPERPLEYSFIDEDLDRLYQTEARFSSILSAISIVAIFISALGIFSLSSYLASRRAKEMSVRKVFGASSIGLLLLQYRQYFILVLLANIATIPICIYGAQQWFSSLAHHIALSPSIFLATLVGSIAVTFFIITFHTLRVAVASPIDMIRNE